jgi:RNA polymerase sigma-70 factor (ECF subfamily)
MADVDSEREVLLVLRAQTGDRDALGELYQRVGGTLARHLQYILKDDALAEDALHDVFIIVHRKLRWLRDPATFRPWVFRIATREAIRMARRRQSRPDLPGAHDYDWLSVATADAERSQDTLTLEREMVAAVSRVSAASRAVLSLHYLEGLTLQESAAVLDLPVGTVKSRLAAGITQIRRWLRRERE